MKVTEVFLSIQGESSWAGYPCVFLRTTGCHLRCVWCDTDYAFYGGRDMSIEEILAKIERIGKGCRLVELTGGEPLLQKEIGPLAECLLERGYTVLCETSGSLDISILPSDVIKILDIKCPGSGEVEKNLWENLDRLASDDEIKFVVRDRADFDWALAVISKHDLTGRKLLFAPVSGELEAQTLAAWMMDDNVPGRLQLQLHKYIWSPDASGV
jgi:7-carboxy-7-deazaguanine synthase